MAERVSRAVYAMVPKPSTVIGMNQYFTSVQSSTTMSIQRFVRAVAYQAFPQSALEPELQDGNPLGIWRMVDGERVR